MRAFIAQRLEDRITIKKAVTENGPAGTMVEVSPAVMKQVSNGEINRELTALKRMFTLAMQAGKILYRPHIPMLKEDNVRTGFFEREQFETVRKHLPEALQPVITFAYITGWRITSEVLSLQWRNVDLQAGEVRLDPGTTKNAEGRVFKLTADEHTSGTVGADDRNEVIDRRGIDRGRHHHQKLIRHTFQSPNESVTVLRGAELTNCDLEQLTFCGEPVLNGDTSGKLREDYVDSHVVKSTANG